MPLDVLGRTRATMEGSASTDPRREALGNLLRAVASIHKGDRGLQMFPVNEEFPVGAIHQMAPIESLPFVHTARRYYRLGDLARAPDRLGEAPACAGDRAAGKASELGHLEEVKVVTRFP